MQYVKKGKVLIYTNMKISDIQLATCDTGLSFGGCFNIFHTKANYWHKYLEVNFNP